MPNIYLTVGPPNSWKTTWIHNYFLSRHNRPMVVCNSSDYDRLSMAVKSSQDIVVDGKNDTLKEREKIWDIILRHQSKKYIKICYLFKQFINNDSVFRSQLDDPDRNEFDDIKVVPRIGKVLDLSKTIGNKRYIVVGDIHGHFSEFLAMIDNLFYNPRTDFLISTGDLVDRGKENVDTLKFFMTQKNVFCVEGNHDNKLKRWLSGSNVKITHGLHDTIDELVDSCVGFRDSVRSFIDDLPQIIRLPDINGRPNYVVHAGIDPTIDIMVQRYNDCLYSRYIGGKDYYDKSGVPWYSLLSDHGPFIQCGHMEHENARPNNNVLCLDGGAGCGKKLRCCVNGTDLFEINAEDK